MSDTMMSVDRARRLTDGGQHTVHLGLVMPAARTVVHQAAQITRLQAALREADRNWHDALNSEYEYTCKPEGFVSTYEALLPGDMENPEVKG